METFTFIIKADFKHCFAQQCEAENLTKDLLLELIHTTNNIPQKMKPLFIDEVTEWYEPAKLDCVNNVWRDIFLVKIIKYLYRYDVNIIKTDISTTIFPLAEKATFTFVTHIRHYNASYQFKAETLEEGIMLWATNIDILNRQQRKILLKYIQKSKNPPVAVEGVKNVWSTSYRIFRPLLTLHIIKTA